MSEASEQEPVRLANMLTLGSLASAGEDGDLESVDLESNRKRVHRAARFRDRSGYQEDFIEKFPVPLPKNPRPGDEAPLLDGSGTELRYEHFSAVISKKRRLPFYVACNIDGAQSRRIARADEDVWFLDGRLDPQHQLGEELYSDNELDRGHLVRREDPVWGARARVANDDTFHFTNCAPQHKGMNQRTWLGLEDYILQNARVHQLKACVFTGPVFRDDDLEYRGVRIPKEYWKLVAIRTEGRRSVTAYMISQAALITDLEFVFGKYKTYQVSVKKVQALTGLGFRGLSRYDGFSNEEESTGRDLRAELESWRDVRI